MYPGNKRKKLWREEKERLLKMTLEERRKEYLRDYVPLKDIPTWKEEMKNKAQSDVEEFAILWVRVHTENIMAVMILDKP
ncbi:MACRO domain-containing protein 2, partial [Ophiophagus hannah]